MQVKGPTGVGALDLSGEGRSPGGAASPGPSPQGQSTESTVTVTVAPLCRTLRPMGTPQARVLERGAAPFSRKEEHRKQAKVVSTVRDGWGQIKANRS